MGHRVSRAGRLPERILCLADETHALLALGEHLAGLFPGWTGNFSLDVCHCNNAKMDQRVPANFLGHTAKGDDLRIRMGCWLNSFWPGHSSSGNGVGNYHYFGYFRISGFSPSSHSFASWGFVDSTGVLVDVGVGAGDCWSPPMLDGRPAS